MAQRSYDSLDSRTGYAGSYSRLGLGRSRSFLYAEVKQVGTLTVGGSATDGVYSVSVVDPHDSNITHTASVTRATTPSSNADIAAALKAAIEANGQLRSLIDVSVLSAVITYTAKRGGEVLAFSTSAPAPGTLVAATTTSAAVADLPVGIAVARNSDGTLRLLTSTD